jgi:putative ABC transport system ATP-binding protein
LEAIEKVGKELGTTVVLITHNASIAGMADRVVTMSDGRIAADRVNERQIAPRELSW